jgi:hypothetical protein
MPRKIGIKNKNHIEYICKKCLKNFGCYKYQYDLHLNRKKPCKSKDITILNDSNNDINDDNNEKKTEEIILNEYPKSTTIDDINLFQDINNTSLINILIRQIQLLNKKINDQYILTNNDELKKINENIVKLQQIICTKQFILNNNNFVNTIEKDKTTKEPHTYTKLENEFEEELTLFQKNNDNIYHEITQEKSLKKAKDVKNVKSSKNNLSDKILLETELDSDFKNKKKVPVPKKIRQLVWNKYVGEDKGKSKCLCCKHTDISQMDFHCGHIISEFNGGKITIDNLKPICSLCNTSMGKTNMNDFIQTHGLDK